MTTKKPPGDETIKGLPGFDQRATDSFVGRSKVSLSDIKKAAETAPEVSQGAWRERVFTPRAVMSRDEVKLAEVAEPALGIWHEAFRGLPVARLTELAPGSIARLQVIRGGNPTDINVTLGGCAMWHAVISIRKLSSLPAFHSEKIALISAGLRPRSPFISA